MFCISLVFKAVLMFQLSERAFHQQWRHLWMSREQYTLRYESRYLVELGRAIDYLMSFAVSIAIQQTLLETALHGECLKNVVLLFIFPQFSNIFVLV